jgi:hypothetical protein
MAALVDTLILVGSASSICLVLALFMPGSDSPEPR